MKKHKYFGEKTVGVSSGISGFASVLGSYQVCHALCLGVLALLSAVGIAAVGMPFFFLTKVAVYFWVGALGLLLLTFLLSLKMRCAPHKTLLLNSGLVIAGTPSSLAGEYTTYTLVVGTIGILMSITWYIHGKVHLYRKRLFVYTGGSKK